MPPKKDDKKAKKGSAPSGITEFNPDHYARKPVDLGDATGQAAEMKRLVGRIANIETLFPAWNVDEEQWHEPIAEEHKKEIVYPGNLKVAKTVTFAEYFNLGPEEPVDPKAKKKDAGKKGADANVAKELSDDAVDENGKALPVMFRETENLTPAYGAASAEVAAVAGSVGSEQDENSEDQDEENAAEFMRFNLPRDFKQRYGTEQVKVRNEQDMLRRKIEELTGAEGVEAEAESNAEEVQQLQAQLQQSLAAHDIEQEGPLGGYVDPYMCNAYKLLNRYVPVMVQKVKDNMDAMSEGFSAFEETHEDDDTKKILNQNYLWRSIYPKLPNGKPCFNPAGKYCVKLYLAGKWRKVYVDDSLPLRNDGLPAVASSDDRLELWPIILTKALYTVYSACGYTTRMADILTEEGQYPKSADAKGAVSSTSTLPVDSVSHAVCHKISQFIAFVLHITTGWEPRAPVAIEDTFKKERAKSAKLLQDIIAEGVCQIDGNELVHDGVEGAGDIEDSDDEEDSDEDDEYAELMRQSSDNTISSLGFGAAIKRLAASTEEAAREKERAMRPDKALPASQHIHRHHSASAVLVDESMSAKIKTGGSIESNSSVSQSSEPQLGPQSSIESAPARLMRKQPSKSKLKAGLSTGSKLDDDEEQDEGDDASTDSSTSSASTGSSSASSSPSGSDNEIDNEGAGIDADISHSADSFRTASDEGDELDSKKPFRTAKHKFKYEYQRRKEHRARAEELVLEREERIAKISSMVDHVTTEITFIVINDPDSGKTEVYPLLGICYSPEHPADLMRVRLLVEWRTGAPHETPFDPNPEPGRRDTKHIQGQDEGPLPLTTPLTQQWLSIKKLCKLKAFLIGVDTQTLTPHGASINRHWVPLADLPPELAIHDEAAEAQAAAEAKNGKEGTGGKTAGGKAGAAAGKEAAVVGEIASEPEWTAHPGATPITLLRLNTSEFFVKDNAPPSRPGSRSNLSSPGAAGGRGSNLTGSRHPKVGRMKRQDSSAEMLAKAMMNLQDDDNDGSGRMSPPGPFPGSRAMSPGTSNRKKPKAEFLHFTLMLHADVVTEYKGEPDPTELAEKDAADAKHYAQPGDDDSLADEDATVVAKVTKKYRKLPSDVTVVLQEIRMDQVVPMIFVMELKDHAFLPVASKSFAISASRLPNDPNQPLIFWVRLFTKTSVYVHCSSEVTVEIGNAEKIWSDLGKPVFMREGRLGVTRELTQQLLFRLPLVIDPDHDHDAPNSKPGSQHGTPAGSPSSSTAHKALTSGDGSRKHYETKCAMSFLFVHDRQIERNISLATLGHDITKPVSPFPRIQGNLLQLSTDVEKASTLLARSFPAYVQGIDNPIVPAFNWKLLVLSDQPLKEPGKPINNEAISQRYFGRYYANNQTALFRDIYRIDKYSFPIGLRLTTKHKRPPSRSRLAIEQKQSTLESQAKKIAPALSLSTQLALKRAFATRNHTNDCCLKLRFYRPSDMKLVTEIKGREGILCYNQVLEPFLEDGETYDVAAATAAAEAAAAEAEAAAADPKAAAKKGGGKKDAAAAAHEEAATDTVDVLVECVLDEYKMNIPEEWINRFPHTFDYFFGTHEDDATYGVNFQYPELEEQVQHVQESIAKQKKNLSAGSDPPSEPQVYWTMDVLAGKLRNVSHDTRELQKQIEQKNAWETSQTGRADKAAAATAYFLERRAYENAQATLFTQFMSPGAVNVNVRSSLVSTRVPLSDSMAEYLMTALSRDAEATRKRYGYLHSMPKHMDKVDVMKVTGRGNLSAAASVSGGDAAATSAATEKKKCFVRQTSVARLSAQSLAELRNQSSTEKAEAEKRYEELVSRFTALNAAMREDTSHRIDFIAQEATADAKTLGQLWESREQFRIYASEQNESLKALLDRAVAAKDVALKAEIKAAEEEAKLAEKLRKEQEKAAKKKK